MTGTTAANAAASSMALLEQMTEIVANNLANADTPGFQAMVAEVTGGPAVAMLRSSDAGTAPLGSVEGTPETITAAVDERPGTVRPTGNPLDLALDGPGYWEIATTTGVALTRNGAFQVDGTGRVVTASGDAVMGTGGPIIIPPGTHSIVIASDGTVSADGSVVGQFQIAASPAPTALVPFGGGLYRSTTPIVAAATQARVVQGALETSNVSSVQEMVRLITILRTYQSATQALNLDDATKTLSSQTVGEVS